MSFLHLKKGLREIVNNYEIFSIDLSTGDITYHNNHNKSNWKVTLIDTGLNTLKGGRIKRLEKYLTDDLNMVTYGDGVANINIKALIDFHKSHGKTITITGVYPPARFGELIEKDGRVSLFQEKPQTKQGWINGGFFVIEPDFFNYIDGDETFLEREPLEKMVSEGELFAYKHNGFWQCMDTKRDHDYLEQIYMKEKKWPKSY